MEEKMKRKHKKNKLMMTIIPIVVICISGILWNNWTQNAKQKEEVKKEEMQNQQYNVISESIEKTEPVENTDSSTIENTMVLEEQQDQQQEQSQNQQVVFDEHVAFIGDSRTQGFIMYTNLKDVIDYSYVGLAVDTAITKPFVKTDDGNKITILEDMKSRELERVYIMLGINELGWAYPEVFREKYCELIDKIREVQPNCKIYVQSIIPVTSEKSENDAIYNNTNINNYNHLIEDMAKSENATFLNVGSILVDRTGNLPKEASTDGIHIKKDYCLQWLEYLKQNV